MAERKAQKGKAAKARGAQKCTPKKADEYRPQPWMKAFITMLSAQGNVSRACSAANIGRRTVYKARESDAVFAEAWDDAMDVAADALEAEAWRRAVDGVEKPVGFYKGAASSFVTEYSDTLLIFLLKGARPEKFRERFEHTGKDGGPIRVQTEKDLSDDELAAIAAGGK